jgi:hypothetical protein
MAIEKTDTANIESERMIDWDPEIDAPAVVAIIGAGPIGIEAALYARFLGYDVLLIDHGKVAGNVLKWGHLKMFTPFHRNSTSLGLAALRAQEPDYKAPAADAYLTGREYAQEYLVPLAKTDLIYDGVHVHSRIVSISRVQSQKEEQASNDDRAGDEFRILIDSKSRGLWTARADIVIDTTGNQSLTRGLAPGGGVPLATDETLQAILPAWFDITGKEGESLRDKEILLVGNGLEAAHAAVVLHEMSNNFPQTKTTWVTLPNANGQPELSSFLCNVQHSPSDDLRQLHDRAQVLLQGASARVIPLAAWGVERIDRDESGKLTATLLTGFEETLPRACDVVIAANGARPDWSFVEPLRVGLCAKTDAPLGSAAALFAGEDKTAEPAWSGNELVTTEPNYYVLGAKSYGYRSGFLLHAGYAQIRSLFALIGGRTDLDLYQRAQEQ